jgi:hypothetical protein
MVSMLKLYHTYKKKVFFLFQCLKPYHTCKGKSSLFLRFFFRNENDILFFIQMRESKLSNSMRAHFTHFF